VSAGDGHRALLVQRQRNGARPIPQFVGYLADLRGGCGAKALRALNANDTAVFETPASRATSQCGPASPLPPRRSLGGFPRPPILLLQSALARYPCPEWLSTWRPTHIVSALSVGRALLLGTRSGASRTLDSVGRRKRMGSGHMRRRRVGRVCRTAGGDRRRHVCGCLRPVGRIGAETLTRQRR